MEFIVDKIVHKKKYHKMIEMVMYLELVSHKKFISKVCSMGLLLSLRHLFNLSIEYYLQNIILFLNMIFILITIELLLMYVQ